MGNPVLIDLDQLFECFNAEIDIDFRHRQTLVGVVHSLKVFFRTEKLDRTDRGTICF